MEKKRYFLVGYMSQASDTQYDYGSFWMETGEKHPTVREVVQAGKKHRNNGITILSISEISKEDLDQFLSEK